MSAWYLSRVNKMSVYTYQKELTNTRQSGAFCLTEPKAALLHPPIKRHRSCEPHLFGQVGFLVRRIVKVVLFGRGELLRMRHQRTRMVFQSQLHWTRSISRIGARNAKVTETFYNGYERVYNVGALVCAGWM